MQLRNIYDNPKRSYVYMGLPTNKDRGCHPKRSTSHGSVCQNRLQASEVGACRRDIYGVTIGFPIAP